MTVDRRCTLRSLHCLTTAILAVVVMSLSADALAARGGPDAGGWAWVDEDEPGVTAISAFPAIWTVLANPLPDETVYAVPISFPFTLYGVTSTTVWVSTNGWISLVDPAGASYPTNTALPNAAPPNATLYYHWDDLQSVAGGSSFAQHGATTNGHVFLFRHYQAPTVSLAQLYVELNRNGNIRLQYTQPANISTITVGIEDETGTIGHQLVYDGVQAPGFVLDNNSIIIFFRQSSPDCAGAIPVSCPTTIDDTTSTGLNLASTYGCGVGTYNGRERTFSLTIPTVQSLTLDLANLGGRQVELLLLRANCDGTFGCVAAGPPPLQLPIVVPGSYFVVVDGRTAADDGPFRLTTACAQAAQPITCGGRVTGSVVAGPSGIDSYACFGGTFTAAERLYSFTLTAPQTVIATLTPAASLDLFLLDQATLTPVSSVCLRGDDNQVGYFDLPAGNYILAVDGTAASTGAFSVDLACPSQVAATAITCGASSVPSTNVAPNLNQTYSCGATTYQLGEAYYRFQPTQYLTVTATLNGVNREVMMFDETRGPSSCSGRGNPVTTIAGVGPGTYLFAVDSRITEGAVDLSLTCQPLTTAPAGCNASASGTTGLVSQLNSYACRSGVLDGGEQIWVIQNPTQQPLSVGLRNTAPGVDLDVMLFDRPFDVSAPNCIDFGDQVAHIANAPAGDYLVVVDGAAATSGATYDLVVECGSSLTCGGPALQCNDLVLTGDTNTGVNGVWRYGDIDDAFTGPEVAFQFTNPIAQPVGFWLRNPSDARLDIILVDSCDRERVIGWGDDRIQLATLPPGTYDLVVDGREGVAGTFDLITFCGGAVLNPPLLTTTVAPGQCIQEHKTLFLPTSATAVDVMFAFDLSISMGGEVSQLRLNAQTLWNELSALIPSLRFGLASFVAYPFTITSGCPGAPPPIGSPWPFMLHQPLTNDFTAFDSALAGLFIPGGAAEPYTRALWEATNNPDIGWRSCIPKLWTNWGDEDPQMDCDAFACIGLPGISTGSDPGRDQIFGTADDPRLLPAVDAMTAAGIVLLPIESSQTQLRFDIWDCLARRTGGRATPINQDGTVPGNIDLSELLGNIILDYVNECQALQLVAIGPGAPWVTVTPLILTGITTPYYGEFTVEVCVPPGTPPGSYPITIEAQCVGNGTCLTVSAQQSIELDVCTMPQPVATGPIAVCEGERVTLDGSGSSGCTPMEYEWRDGATVVCPWSSGPTCDVTPAAPSTTYTLATRCGQTPCADATTIDVAVTPPPVADVVAVGPLCAGTTALLDASPSVGCVGAGGIEYQWRNGAAVLCPWQVSATCAVVPPAGTTTYTVEVRCVGRTTCADSTTVNVTVQTPPTASATPPPLVCVGTTVTLDGTPSVGCSGAGGVEYQWRNGATVLCPWQTSPTCAVTPSVGATSYSLDVRCVALPTCIDTTAVVGVAAPLPTAATLPPSRVCEGTAVMLDATPSSGCTTAGGLEYQWRDGATVICSWRATATCPVTPPAGTTSYTVDVRCVGLTTCSQSAIIAVTPVPFPVAAAGPDTTVCANTVVTLDAAGSTDRGCPNGVEYEWRDGATIVRPWGPSPSWMPPTATVGVTSYTVLVRCVGGPPCSASDAVSVTVNPCTVLAVRFDRYEARWSKDHTTVRIEWVTLEEDGSVGFVVERALAQYGRYTEVALVAATGPHTYEVVDSDVPDNSTPWYRIVEYTVDGLGDSTAEFAVTTSDAPTGGRDGGGRHQR